MPIGIQIDGVFLCVGVVTQHLKPTGTVHPGLFVVRFGPHVIFFVVPGFTSAMELGIQLLRIRIMICVVVVIAALFLFGRWWREFVNGIPVESAVRCFSVLVSNIVVVAAIVFASKVLESRQQGKFPLEGSIVSSSRRIVFRQCRMMIEFDYETLGNRVKRPKDYGGHRSFPGIVCCCCRCFRCPAKKLFRLAFELHGNLFLSFSLYLSLYRRKLVSAVSFTPIVREKVGNLPAVS